MWLNDLYHKLDPIALAVGPIAIRWYGIAYLVGFVLAGYVMWRTARRWQLPLDVDDVITLITGLACGVIIGGRLGYVLFYGKGPHRQGDGVQAVIQIVEPHSRTDATKPSRAGPW